MKFIHLADAHLDSPFLGLSFLPSKAFNRIYQAADQSLAHIIDLAIAEKVDLVLIAGDTFDSNHPSPRSQLFFKTQIERLIAQKIQVVMIFGNHDHMDRSELLIPDSPYFKLLGNREIIERATFVTETGFNYDVVGFSYFNNHITSNKLVDFPSKSSNYTFGLMHAQMKASEASQNVYAPYELNDLVRLNYDYFALGHIHKRSVLSDKPWAVYPGNIQGRHVNELLEKGCYLGEIDEASGKTKLNFVETAPILWQQVAITLTKPLSKADLQTNIIQTLNNTNTTNKKTVFYSLKIIGAEWLSAEETELVTDSTFWQSFSGSLIADSQLVDVRLESGKDTIELDETSKEFFSEALKQVFDDKKIQQILKTWAKKSKLTETLSGDENFLEEVKALTQVKLLHELEGIKDEATED